MFTAIVKTLVNGVFLDYKTTLTTKYQLECATAAIARTRPDAVVMIGEDLAILAGQFISARIVEKEETK